MRSLCLSLTYFVQVGGLFRKDFMVGMISLATAGLLQATLRFGFFCPLSEALEGRAKKS